MTSFQWVLADCPSAVPTIRNNKAGAILQDAFQVFDLCWREEDSVWK